MRTLDDGTPAGYGRADRELAERLSQAESAAEADRIARLDGHKDVNDARLWLFERSDPVG
jgi:hypothetical protein